MVAAAACVAAVAAVLSGPAQAAEGSGAGGAAGTGRTTSAAGTGRTTSAAGVADAAGAAGAENVDLSTYARHLDWDLKPSGTEARFRGLAAVSRSTAWVAGSEGTVLRTTDGGSSWADVSPPGAGELLFRDIEAFDRRRAVVLAIGPGEASRVFRTEDGGRSWTESFRNDEPEAFYDCMTFFDRRNGLAMSDPVDGKFRILSTGDGGRSWRVLPSEGMVEALPGEAGFAASGQCLVSQGRSDVWLATGGGARSRVLHSSDRGLTWTAAETTIPAGEGARGVFALAFRSRTQGIAVGGDYRPDQDSPQAAAVSGDGGSSWQAAAEPPPAYRSGVTWVPHTRSVALAVGPTGTDITFDGGRSWHVFDDGSFDSVDCARDFGCWAAGEQGRIARLER